MINNNHNSVDLLKVENLDKNEYVVTASVIAPPLKKVEKKKRQVTLFGAILSAISNRKRNDVYRQVAPVKTVNYFVLILVFTILLYFFYQFSDVKLSLAIIIFFGALAFPLLLLVLYYELCPQKEIGLFQIIISLIFGIILYLLIEMIEISLLSDTPLESLTDLILIPLLWGFGEFIFVRCLKRMYDITDLSIGILLAVSVGVGYAIGFALDGLIDSIFLPVEVIMESTGNHYSGLAIVDNRFFIQDSIKGNMVQLLWRCFYYPTCFTAWSVIIGEVIMTPTLAEKDKRGYNVSIYLLLLLVISLFIFSRLNTSFDYVNTAIKILSIIVSLIIGIRSTNKALNYSLKITN